MRYKYCPECGARLSEISAGDDGMVPYCEHCAKRWFDTFQSCVVVLTYNEYDEIALSSQWYLPDEYLSITTGYMKPGETAEEAAVREVREELGLALENPEYAGTYWLSEVDQLLHAFIGFAPKRDFVLSDEVTRAEWVSADEAPGKFFPDKPGGALSGIYQRYLDLRKPRENLS